jgi:hypothetical protein
VVGERVGVGSVRVRCLSGLVLPSIHGRRRMIDAQVSRLRAAPSCIRAIG